MAKPDEVYIDVYPWVKEISENPLSPVIPMCGLFRHAEGLCKLYRPALIWDNPKNEIGIQSVERLENYLGKGVGIIYATDCSEKEINDLVSNRHGGKVWISIAPDCSGPAVNSEPAEFKRLCIVHDTMATERIFGELNKINFEKGAKYSDAFAFVSNYARYKFITYCQRKGIHDTIAKEWIDYGCFHRYSELPELIEIRDSRRSLSVHGLYPHKRIDRIADSLQQWTGYKPIHLHVGKFVNELPSVIIGSAKRGIRFVGPIPDKELDQLYQQSSAFYCLSDEEGFSMPPMEAIINGVPAVYLSDIPVHKEIYSEIDGVIFWDQKENGWSPMTGVTPGREYLFEKYHFDKVSKGVQSYIASV